MAGALRGWAVYLVQLPIVGGPDVGTETRMTDFFPRREACPRPHKWGEWRGVDFDVREKLMGEFGDGEAAKLWSLADREIYDPDECRVSRQQAYRDWVNGSGYHLLADIPQEWPAE